jgi:hypothetical protein
VGPLGTRIWPSGLSLAGLTSWPQPALKDVEKEGKGVEKKKKKKRRVIRV